jgi:hypothetical protein
LILPAFISADIYGVNMRSVIELFVVELIRILRQPSRFKDGGFHWCDKNDIELSDVVDGHGGALIGDA